VRLGSPKRLPFLGAFNLVFFQLPNMFFLNRTQQEFFAELKGINPFFYILFSILVAFQSQKIV